jgi:hypothetical protein
MHPARVSAITARVRRHLQGETVRPPTAIMPVSIAFAAAKREAGGEAGAVNAPQPTCHYFEHSSREPHSRDRAVARRDSSIRHPYAAGKKGDNRGIFRRKSAAAPVTRDTPYFAAIFS